VSDPDSLADENALGLDCERVVRLEIVGRGEDWLEEVVSSYQSEWDVSLGRIGLFGLWDWRAVDSPVNWGEEGILGDGGHSRGGETSKWLEKGLGLSFSWS